MTQSSPGAAFMYVMSSVRETPDIIGGPQNVGVCIMHKAVEVKLDRFGDQCSTRSASETYVSTIQAAAAPCNIPIPT